MTLPGITIGNIENYRGNLNIAAGQLSDDIWSVFDRSVFDCVSNGRIVPIPQIVSTKNQLEDPKYLNGTKADPRQTAFERMRESLDGTIPRRAPLSVERLSDGRFVVLDGNATVQVLMFLGWKEVPVFISNALLVFPGSGSPDHPNYRAVYDLLETGAYEAGWSIVDRSLRWPGQYSNRSKWDGSTLTFSAAVDRAVEHVRRYESQHISYGICARSFGVYVTLKAIRLVRPKHLSQMILWAPPAYWKIWQMLVDEAEKTRSDGREKGVELDLDFFQEIEPLECLLAGVEIPTTVSGGKEDPLCPPWYLRFLSEELCDNCNLQIVSSVPNCGHEIKMTDSADIRAAFFRALFGSNVRINQNL